MSGFITVFSKPRYTSYAIVVAFVVLTLALLVPHRELIYQVATSASPGEIVAFLLSMYGLLLSNFTPLGAVTLILISLLFGVNIALITYLLRRNITLQKGVSKNALGMMFGVLGMGCAACGSLLVTGVLSLFGSAWLITLLPLKGGEFGVLGVLILAYSTYTLSVNIARPPVCVINTENHGEKKSAQ